MMSRIVWDHFDYINHYDIDPQMVVVDISLSDDYIASHSEITKTIVEKIDGTPVLSSILDTQSVVVHKNCVLYTSPKKYLECLRLDLTTNTTTVVFPEPIEFADLIPSSQKVAVSDDVVCIASISNNGILSIATFKTSDSTNPGRAITYDTSDMWNVSSITQLKITLSGSRDRMYFMIRLSNDWSTLFGYIDYSDGTNCSAITNDFIDSDINCGMVAVIDRYCNIAIIPIDDILRDNYDQIVWIDIPPVVSCAKDGAVANIVTPFRIALMVNSRLAVLTTKTIYINGDHYDHGLEFTRPRGTLDGLDSLDDPVVLDFLTDEYSAEKLENCRFAINEKSIAVAINGCVKIWQRNTSIISEV